MAPSRVDDVNLRTWTAAIATALLSFVCVTVDLIAANFKGIGFPCVYYHIVDYENLNVSVYNVMHELTPQLYLDPGQIVSYVVFMQFTFLAVLIYYVTCWAKIYFRRDPGLNLNQATRDIRCVGDASSCFLYVMCMFTFQLFTMMLAFRLPSMIAFSHCLHYICLSVYALTMITSYQSYERSSFDLSKLHPMLHGTIKFKTVAINLVLTALGFATMVLAMSLCLGFGNNFFVRTGDMVFGTLATFSVVAALYLVLIEVLLHRYVKVCVGYHIGTFCGICGALYPVLRYENLAASQYSRGIHIGLFLMFLGWAAFTICRAIRFFTRRQRRFRMLDNSEEIRSLKNATDD